MHLFLINVQTNLFLPGSLKISWIVTMYSNSVSHLFIEGLVWTFIIYTLAYNSNKDQSILYLILKNIFLFSTNIFADFWRISMYPLRVQNNNSQVMSQILLKCNNHKKSVFVYSVGFVPEYLSTYRDSFYRNFLEVKLKI